MINDVEWRDNSAADAKRLFGRPVRILLSAWILSRLGDPFYLLEAQIAMQRYGESSSAVSDEIRLLASRGLVIESKESRRVYFLEARHEYWRAFLAIAVSLRVLDSTETIVIEQRWTSTLA